MPGTWAEEQQFPSLEAWDMEFRGQEGALSLLECWDGVVHRPGTHLSCPAWGAGPWQGPPLVHERVVAYLGTQGQ